MNKLDELISRCKCSVSVTANPHRDYYQTATDWLEEMKNIIDNKVSSEMRENMINLDTIIEIQFYLYTPVCFHVVVHYDLDKALNEALAIALQHQYN
jgi:hypothetical protein